MIKKISFLFIGCVWSSSLIASDSTSFDLDKMDNNPMIEFIHFYNKAVKKIGQTQAQIGVLSTSSRRAIPFSQAVSFDYVADNGIEFFGDKRSQKFINIAENPHVAITFYWHALGQEVVLCGKVQKLHSKRTEEVFEEMPREKQLTFLASNKSEVIENLSEVEKKRIELAKKYKHEPIPVSKYWIGYSLLPEEVIFTKLSADNVNKKIYYRATSQLYKYHNDMRYKYLIGGKWKKNLISP